MRITILGKRWNLERVKTLNGKYGDCDNPNKPHRTIRVLRHLRGKSEMKYIIHEMLHGADWYKDEEWVKEIAENLSTVLYDQMGYRVSGRERGK